ncbi:hypothetical protein Tco_1399758 [Tanacetum coccineum]
MDDLYNNLKIYEAKVMGSSSISQNTQNVAFVSSNSTGSTNEAVKTAPGVSATNSKANASTLPNVDSLSDVVIYSFLITMVECIIRHRRGHFDREYRAQNQDSRKQGAYMNSCAS